MRGEGVRIGMAPDSDRPAGHRIRCESLCRFDVSPDGERLVFERVRENSGVVLIEMDR
jgi:hypothetical protein